MRLEVVKRLLVRRDENHANLTSKKLDHIWCVLLSATALFVGSILRAAVFLAEHFYT